MDERMSSPFPQTVWSRLLEDLEMEVTFIDGERKIFPVKQLSEVPELKGYTLPEEIVINGTKYRKVK